MALKIIPDYLQTKVRDIKFYEGTSLAQEVKEELREHLDTLKQNDPSFKLSKTKTKISWKMSKRCFSNHGAN